MPTMWTDPWGLNPVDKWWRKIKAEVEGFGADPGAVFKAARQGATMGAFGLGGAFTRTADFVIPDRFWELTPTWDKWGTNWAIYEGILREDDGIADHSEYKCGKAAGYTAEAALALAAGLGAVQAANNYFMPQTLYHFTSAEGAQAIASSGQILPTKVGLWGSGTYFTAFNNATIATLQGASSTQAVIAVSSTAVGATGTYFPGTYIVQGGVVLP